MHATLWQAVEDIFASVVDLPGDDQRAAVSRLCGDRLELRAEVESLLAAHGRAGTFLEAIPDRVGPYEILGEIGRGGMGVVYRARRADGQFDQDVAIKFLGQQRSASLYRRFLHERQILASLSHPNIARLLDGGITPSGASYIVMEFVDGVPLAEYCRSRAVAERLTLFRAICSAVQYAHQHLVVHRDLKPANILVTVDGSPKLLDFGIAKIVAPDQPSGETTVAPAMTPDYASPEQMRGARVSTASDIYALGVLLYELLTGRRPYVLAERPYDEMVRIVSEAQHDRPSTGSKDLDAIVARAMRPDPDERYASAEALSADVGRYLAHQPVEARRRALWYTFSKFVTRHRTAVVAATAAATLLVAAFAMTIRQSRLAERRFQDVRGVATALMFDVHDAIAVLPGSTGARKAIVTQGLEYLDRLSRDSAGDEALQREIAAGYVRLGDVQGLPSQANLGDARGAIASYRKALGLLDALSLDAPNDIAMSIEQARVSRRLGLVLSFIRETEEARRVVAAAVARLEDIVRRAPTDAHRAHLASAYNNLADVGGSSEPRYKALEILEDLLARDPENAARQRDVAIVHKTIAAPLVLRSGGDRALPHLQRAEALDAARAAARPDDRDAQMDLSFDYSQNGMFFLNRDRHADALENFQKSLAIRRRLAALDPADARLQDRLVYMSTRVGWSLQLLKRPAEALTAYQESVRGNAALLAKQPDHPQYLSNLALAQTGIGDATLALGRRADACGPWREAKQIYERLDRDGSLRPEERKTMERLRGEIARCPPDR
jgi:eukaryotic-like serine/threonine-protein kinase